MSVRTLSRRFQAETGLSPLPWLLHQRIDRARELLETTGLPMDQVAGKSGLGSADSLRKHMVSRVGLTPTAYRASFSRAPTGASRGGYPASPTPARATPARDAATAATAVAARAALTHAASR
ncbi:hypothetical protein SVIO_041220 [Streptomyces violaceusniger]|uniref:HTH araC/xylS-type domain-containing protein n=1 Tax=Streptomyces violaceusniger TaxID=68280 RepID=A0A4D4L644_STRVO|nr:hypothetical protein SVIO_041220 [Streptomyces violaceusniger]